jgi:hypothetical protein
MTEARSGAPCLSLTDPLAPLCHPGSFEHDYVAARSASRIEMVSRR